jgi:hypothetical protein
MTRLLGLGHVRTRATEVAACKFGAELPCDLHAFRFGKNPNIKLTYEQQRQLRPSASQSPGSPQYTES